ncbi:DUF732 domain-containing protein [Mycobacterium sp. IDR2000157661]|uniref:DUF732 domain-containing protein n=1 Tax=Mycobacterium sp. IDR2000157661 TaxID=2867005 RepID=UPI001EE9EAD6|nr:DUF732 domain-containing protein [Mycobacterium sp. IDR2000157661]ULE33965.1 DUF732 domain-containing protein [Mycobacterium sp. IDR2000157661]
MSVAPANADEKDDKFIAQLDSEHVPYANRTEAIRAAKDFCVASIRQSSPNPEGRGTPRGTAVEDLSLHMGWTATETQEFIRAANPIYCR